MTDRQFEEAQQGIFKILEVDTFAFIKVYFAEWKNEEDFFMELICKGITDFSYVAGYVAFDIREALRRDQEINRYEYVGYILSTALYHKCTQITYC